MTTSDVVASHDVEATGTGDTKSDVCRLVIYGLGPGGARAGVYPVDANPYTAPLATFKLAPQQRLPRTEPGAVAEVNGCLEKGQRPTFVVDGVTIEPAGSLHGGRGPHLR